MGRHTCLHVDTHVCMYSCGHIAMCTHRENAFWLLEVFHGQQVCGKHLTVSLRKDFHLSPVQVEHEKNKPNAAGRVEGRGDETR